MPPPYKLVDLENEPAIAFESDEFQGDLRCAIRNVEWFYVEGDDIGFAMRSIAGDIVGIQIPRQEVLEYDALIPEVIDALIQLDADPANQVIIDNPGYLLRTTIEHWNTRPISLELPSHGPLYISSIYSLEPYSGYGDIIGSIRYYETRTTPTGIEYCAHVESGTFTLTPEWLEYWYPGSINRIHTAQALDYNWREKVQYVFESKRRDIKFSGLPDDLSI